MSATPAWEQSKENAAPLQRGRNVATLERATTRPGLQPRKDSSQEMIQHYENLVRPSEAPHVTEMDSGNDDPLEHWLAYIKFYQNTFPSDTHDQFLLMERCTRALVKMGQYADDDRFVGVCAKYADKTKDPAQVFKYLYTQKVGVNTALFFVAWAYVAEKDNDFQFAEQIFQKGIKKDAQPLQTLKARYQQFQRRMSRHWLNSSQRNDNDQLDEEEDEASTRSRAVFGGLSGDRARRNDRGAQRNQRSRGLGRQNVPSQHDSNGQSSTGFAIFTEEEGGEAGFLDQSLVENKRVIERHADRRKENAMDAERWNERGGLHTTTSNRILPTRSHTKGAPPAFNVFVDEECAAQHERETEERRSHNERQRRERDERTFRERSDEGLVERLTRDPLRYVKDPSRLESDLATREEEHQHESTEPAFPVNKSEKRSRTGFNKRLLKNDIGKEQSFEEARANSKFYTIAPPSINFNLLRVDEADQSSQMDLDEEASIDVSMDESVPQFDQEPRLKVQRLGSKTGGKVLFRTEASFDRSTSLNKTAISTASSTVQELNAVGVPTKKEEETINTKFAMRELSMMFSSPAYGVDDVARKTEQSSRVNQSTDGSQHCGVDVSYCNVGDILGTSMLDNSILNIDGADSENRGPRNPFARSTATPGFEKMALRELESESDADESLLQCSTGRQRPLKQALQEDPLRGSEVELTDDPGFRIYQDDTDENPVADRGQPSGGVGFSIFEDADDKEQGDEKAEPSGGLGFTLFEDGDGIKQDDEKKAPTGGQGFTIFEDGVAEGAEETSSSEDLAKGDTASFSLFGDAVAILDDERSNRSKSQAALGRASTNSGGETATLSLFNEAFNEINEASASSPKRTGGFEIFVDNDEEGDHESNSVLSSPCRSKTSSNGNSDEENVRTAVDYDVIHGHDIKMSLRRLQTTSSVASNSRAPLLSLLTTEGSSFHLPHLLVPRELRGKRVVPEKTKVVIGKHSGLVRNELGRGAYGVVLLMDVEGSSNQDTIALKVQYPTDCLAWEYEILRRMEQRLSSKHSGDFGFPRALSFISLADGGMMSMTAGSKSGLNLVDLANVYKLRIGEPVPEVIVLHYTSRMLKYVELLHWHGQILHCDIKPDNFVLSTRQCPESEFSDIEYSDLMLVDFGRAVDLTQFSDKCDDVRNMLLHGNACKDDMRCVAMRDGKPWSFDIDTYGILCTVHVLLHGSHMEIRKGKDNNWRPISRLKRYWEQDLWTEIFNSLLNLDDVSGAAIGSRARSLRALREKIDIVLKEKESTLRPALIRQVSFLPLSREKL